MQGASWKEKLHAHWPFATFVVLLGLHAFLVTRNFDAGFLAGHEFRQTQTAISIHYIRQEHNFSLAYPTPVLGKPWSIPMEFPLYQWCVALLADATGWPLQVAGRFVSLLCFYATLPAIWLLLAEAGVARRGRWLTLAVVVTAPVHIFYSRAVLIESMALAFSLWQLLAFCRWMRTRAPVWLVLTAYFGIGATLVKVTTAMIWMSVAGAITLWQARQALRESFSAATGVLFRAALSAAAPVVAALWWVHTADEIKALSAAGRNLRSATMNTFNFGTLADRYDANFLRPLFDNWNVVVSPLWLGLPVIMVALLVERRRAWLIVVSFAPALLAVATFIRLYSYHDYYFFAMACAPLVATGLACAALEERPRLRWLGMLAFALVCTAQLHSYATRYAALQFVPSNGGNNLTDLIRDASPTNSVMLVAGEDWSPVLPYYAKRRAFMIANHYLDDPSLLAEAFEQLKGENVCLLVLTGQKRNYHQFRQLVSERFGLRNERTLSDADHDVYATQDAHDALCRHFERYPNYASVTKHGHAAPPVPGKVKYPLITDNAPHDLTGPQAAEHFSQVSPLPHRYSCRFGFSGGQVGESSVLGAHPDSALWVRIRPGARRILCGYGLAPDAYHAGADNTDGVRFEIVLLSNGKETALLARDLKPADNAADQGTQTFSMDLPEGTTGELIFRTSPIDTLRRDWAYWTKIEVR